MSEDDSREIGSNKPTGRAAMARDSKVRAGLMQLKNHFGGNKECKDLDGDIWILCPISLRDRITSFPRIIGTIIHYISLLPFVIALVWLIKILWDETVLLDQLIMLLVYPR